MLLSDRGVLRQAVDQELAADITPIDGWRIEPVYLRDNVAHQHRRG